MKPVLRTILIMILLGPSLMFLHGNLLPQTSMQGDARSLGLGGAVTGIVGLNNIQTMNPAALFFASENRLQAGIEYLDTFPLYGQYGSLEDYIQSPSASYFVNFISRGWSIGAFSDYCIGKVTELGTDESFYLRATRLNMLEVGFSFGLGPLAVGGDVRASKRSYIGPQSFSPDYDLVTFLPELLQKVFLNEYSPLGDEMFMMGLGVMMNLGPITLGAYSENFLNFITGSGSLAAVDVDALISGLDIGLSFSTNPYSVLGQLRLAQFLAALDIHDFGDNEKRTLRAGVEGTLQVTNRLSLALLVGYYQPLGSLESLVSLFDVRNGGEEGLFKDGIWSLGLTADLVFMTVNGALLLPSETLGALAAGSHLSAGADITGKVTFGFFL